MKYGVMGSFVKLAFANTVFGYLEKRLPDLDMASYKRRALSEYKAIVARSPSVGPMRDNMFVVSMYAAAFVIALYKAEPELLTPDVLQGLAKAASYHAQAVWHLQTLRAGGSRPHPRYLCAMDYYTFKMQGAVLDRTKTLGYGDDECNFHLMSAERAAQIGFTRSPDAK